MLTQEQRDKLCEIALSWRGTPYRGNACLKHVGCDCLQFLAAVYEEAGLFDRNAEPDLANNNYSVQAHWHSEDPRYMDGILRWMTEVDTPLPGDLVMFWIEAKTFNHSGIVVSWPDKIVNCRAEGVAVNTAERGVLRRSKKRFFTWKG